MRADAACVLVNEPAQLRGMYLVLPSYPGIAREEALLDVGPNCLDVLPA